MVKLGADNEYKFNLLEVHKLEYKLLLTSFSRRCAIRFVADQLVARITVLV